MAEWPLTGRVGELAAIEAAFRRPHLTGVLLTGAWGVGKSRLAQEAAAQLAPAERVTACRALQTIPYGAITHLSPGPGDGRALLSRLIARFRGPARTVLVVDDVHFLDDASDALLAQLVTACPVFLIGTTGGDVPEALADLWNSGRITGLPITPLPGDAMAALVDRVAGADAIDRHRLTRLSGGNPLALRALVDNGPYGRWLDKAGPAARQVVEVLACAEAMPMSLLETLVEPAAVEAAERAGLIRVDAERACLAPPLSGPLVRRLLTTSTLRRVRGLLPEKPTDHPGPDTAEFEACLARKDLHGAQELADRGYRESVAAEIREAAATWAGLRGRAEAMQGRVRSAAASFREAAALTRSRKCEWMAELADPCDHPHTGVLAARIALRRAWSHAARGEIGRAIECCLAAATEKEAEATALYDAARLGAASAVHARLAELGHADEAMAARALARRDADALGRATDAFEQQGRLLLAAETATAAAHAHRRAGHHKPATLFQERAEALAQRCEGARTPLLDQGRLPSQLTTREREVVLLAPSLTSPQIAARLGLSPRTVSNYLQSAYDKLGLAGRAELRVLLGT
ncbi:helix-turn-helix transcriptional regulator [Paractinoplanes durhamensis]|nr:LuxR family transcriptional regulator [Actinoplanes durhamensis]